MKITKVYKFLVALIPAEITGLFKFIIFFLGKHIWRYLLSARGRPGPDRPTIIPDREPSRLDRFRSFMSSGAVWAVCVLLAATFLTYYLFETAEQESLAKEVDAAIVETPVPPQPEPKPEIVPTPTVTLIPSPTDIPPSESIPTEVPTEIPIAPPTEVVPMPTSEPTLPVIPTPTVEVVEEGELVLLTFDALPEGCVVEEPCLLELDYSILGDLTIGVGLDLVGVGEANFGPSITLRFREPVGGEFSQVSYRGEVFEGPPPLLPTATLEPSVPTLVPTATVEPTPTIVYNLGGLELEAIEVPTPTPIGPLSSLDSLITYVVEPSIQSGVLSFTGEIGSNNVTLVQLWRRQTNGTTETCTTEGPRAFIRIPPAEDMQYLETSTLYSWIFCLAGYDLATETRVPWLIPIVWETIEEAVVISEARTETRTVTNTIQGPCVRFIGTVCQLYGPSHTESSNYNVSIPAVLGEPLRKFRLEVDISGIVEPYLNPGSYTLVVFDGDEKILSRVVFN